MAGDYTDFDGIGSGESGTVESLLPIEGSAERFRYQKHIIVNAILPQQAAFIDLTGEWKMRIRESDAQNNDPDGAYIGTILFEQTVKWTARIVVDQTGSAFWMPLGDAGSGKQMTSICNGESCAIVEDVNDADAMKAYGQTGAWRFVDASIRDNATDRQKYDAEKGFTIFDSSTSYRQFFADWQSAGYFCEISEDAILETVYDRWSGAFLDSEAHYLFSYVPGTPLGIGLAADHVGGLCVAINSKQDDKKGVLLKYRRDDETNWEDRLFTEGLSAPMLVCAAGDDYWMLVNDADKKVLLYGSVDYGRSIKLMGKPFENPAMDDGVKLDPTVLVFAAFCALPDGGAAVLATEKGTSPLKLWMVVSRDQVNWHARSIGELPKPDSAKTLGMVHETISGGSRLVISNGTDLLRVTGDEGRSFKDVG